MKYMIKKDKIKTKSTLVPTSTVGIRSDSDNRIPMSILLPLLVTAAVFCCARLLSESFGLFGSLTAEPTRSGFFPSEKSAFYFWLIVGCLPISFAHTLHKHSFKATALLLGLFSAWFGLHYKLTANGFVRAANKVIYMVLYVQNKIPTQYYLPYFDPDDAKRELLYFMYAVAFGLCFLLSYIGVRRCSALWFTLLCMTSAALPIAFDLLTCEGCFVALVLMCIIMYCVTVQGYRRTSKDTTVVSFGKTLRIHGKYASYSSFQYAVLLLVCSAVVLSIVHTVIDEENYKRSDEMTELGNDILYSVENVVLGTALDSMGIGTSNTLNNGQLSRLGDLEYSGATMFEIKSSSAMQPLYLRSYCAADYTGKRWQPLSGSTYRSYDFWSDFKEDELYPQFMFAEPSGFMIGDANTIKLDIKNRNINHKIFLTDSRVIPSQTLDALGKSTYKYDGMFAFNGFGGVVRYNETVLNTALIGSFSGGAYVGGITEGTAQQSLYGLLHDGDFSTPDLLYSFSPDYASEVEGFSENENEYRQFVTENYLDYPDNIDEYLPEYFDETIQTLFDDCMTENYFSSYYDPEDSIEVYTFDVQRYYSAVISYIRDYLHTTAEYTLSPGKTPSGRDFVEYFINENHEGYCVHFATAAAVMLRRAGIPARYCEGYYVGTDDIDPLHTSYDGFARIPDSRAHAWVEVYVPTAGWQTAEFTPSYSDGSIPIENKLSTRPQAAFTDEDSTDSETDTETETNTQTDSDIQTESDEEEQSDSASSVEKDSSDSEVIIPKKPLISPKVKAALLRIFKTILFIVLIIVAWLALRLAVCKIRAARFSRKDTRKAALAIYFYSLAILRLMDVTRKKGEGEEAFSLRTASLLAGVSQKQHKAFTVTALSARFGKNAPSENAIAEMRSHINALLGVMYASKPRWKKLIIKYILFFD